MLKICIFDQSLTTDKHELVRIKFLQFFFCLCVLIIPFFIIKNNVQYAQQEWNWVSIPLYILFLMAPLYGKFSKNYFRTAIVTVSMASLILSILIFEAGGMDAPGLVWLSAIPVTYAIAIGRMGGIIGALFLLANILLFKFLENAGIHVGTISFSDSSYRLERMVDTVMFAIYTIFTTQYYIRNEEIASMELQASRLEVESLLRTLMHDIATPVTVSSLGLQQLLKAEITPEVRKKAMRRIEVGLDNITKILQQIRALKAMQDGKSTFKKENICVNSCISSILELLETNASAKKIKFEFIPNPRSPTILADQVVFKNIIVANFLSNAIKFSHENGVIKISVDLKNNKTVQVQIIDDGIGIPPEIFVKIWKIDSVTSRPGTSGEKGTGYGMPLAKEFTEKMGGHVELITSTNEHPNGPTGTRVLIDFPVSQIA